MTIEHRAVYPLADLELRQVGDNRRIRGTFKYGDVATISDRGETRKETFLRGAFRFAIDDPAREIHVLRGHDFDQTIGRRPAQGKGESNTVIVEGPGGVDFTVNLPPEARWNAAQREIVLDMEQNLVGGISPGFQIPPSDVVPDAVRLVAEPGNPGVFIRTISAALLIELSLVARPAYLDTEAEVRDLFGDPVVTVPRGTSWYSWL